MPPAAPSLGSSARGVPFAAELATHGDRVALVSDGQAVTYRRLSELVNGMASRLGTERRLVLVEGANTLEAVVAYLAALSAGHPVLLAPADRPDAVASLVRAYDPDVVVGLGPGGWQVMERRAGSVHELHADLALLMSTSGSTGSPKLVRLSSANVQSNAASIAEYLRLNREDRAATTLPMHYCYGLSVINSHLLTGAAVLLTDLSVVDACFWRLFRAHRGTNFAGVPYTFELLDRVGFADLDLPDLRFVTQAGGRMAPDTVRRYAVLGRRRGWDLYVMYGQTEATARMAYLPPALAAKHPECIGVAIPGGSFSLEMDDPDVAGGDPSIGELVYTGPNVMMGYATSPDDLARGATLDRLHTGDLARRDADGLYQVVGRRSRFAKVFGLRLDLGRIEDQLARDGVRACCVESDDRLLVAVQGIEGVDHVARRTAELCGIPAGAVRVARVAELPRLSNGKPDYGAVRALVPSQEPTAVPGVPDTAGGAAVTGSPEERTAALVALFAELLARPDATADSTFVSLGGDSLSYVELSVRLEESLGRLPVGWHTRSIGELAADSPAPTGRGRAVEVSVVLRAVGIVLVVATHIGVLSVLGGAHVLLTLAGFNLARFHLTSLATARPSQALMRSAARIALPSVVVIGAGQALTGSLEPRELLLLNSLLGPTSAGRFWFVEVLVYLFAAVACLLAVPAVGRVQRSYPFGLPVALVLAALLTRYQVIGATEPAIRIYSAHVVIWLFALGWAAAAAYDLRRRVLVTALALVTIPGFFNDGRRDAVVVAGLCALLWIPTVRLPSAIARTASVVAAGSLYIYLCHWFVYPRLQATSGALALVASMTVGLLCWTAATGIPRQARDVVQWARHRAVALRPTTT